MARAAAIPRAVAILGALPIGAAPARAAPANTLTELWRILGDCAKLDTVPDSATGSEVTVVFSLKRDGSLLGQPRISHSRLVGSEGDRRDFIAGALTSISRCLPIPLTDGMGGAIAGRPLRLRITSRKPERAL